MIHTSITIHEPDSFFVEEHASGDSRWVDITFRREHSDARLTVTVFLRDPGRATLFAAALREAAKYVIPPPPPSAMDVSDIPF